MMQDATLVDVKLFQNPSILINGQPQTLRSKKGEALFYYLILEKTASREILSSLIWGEEDSEQARRHLRDTIYLLKKQLGDIIISKDRFTVQLNPNCVFRCDADLLLQQKDPSVYKGEFLHNFNLPNSEGYEDWARRNREQFREAYLRALSTQAENAMRGHELSKAEKFLQAYLREEPMSETSTVQLMQLYRLKGDYSKAASIYQKLRRYLLDEMGITPLKETASLYYSIMDEWNSRAEAEKSLDDKDFTERKECCEYLFSLFQGEHPPKGVVITGEAGVGKTHILRQLLSTPPLDSRLIITASCYKSKAQTPFYSWQAITLGLTRYIVSQKIEIPKFYPYTLSTMFPSFAGLQPEVRDLEDSDFFRPGSLVDALVAVLCTVAEKHPVLLAFENIQWMDSNSVTLLDQVLRGIPGQSLLILATGQPAVSDDIQALLASAQDDGLLVNYELPPFTKEEIFRFIEQRGGQALSTATKEQLFHQAHGNILILEQMLTYLKEHGDGTVPTLTVEDEIAIRTQGLGKESLHILNMIAMFPEYAPFEVLCQLSGKSSMDLLYISKDLCRRALVTERYDGGIPSLSISLPEYRSFLYSNIPTLDKNVLHYSIANIVANTSPERIPNRDVTLEYQYEQSGDLLNAFRYKVERFSAYIDSFYDQSGDNYDRRFNVDRKIWDSFFQLEQELQDLYPKYCGTRLLDELAAKILYIKSWYGICTGQYDQALPALQKLLSRKSNSGKDIVNAHKQMANCAIQVCNTELLEEHIEAGLSCASSCGDRKNIAMLERYKGLLYILRGNYPEARIQLQKALNLVSEAFVSGLGHDIQTAYTFNYIGEAYRMEGIYPEALEMYKKAVDLVENQGYITCRTIFYANLGQVLFAMGQYISAKEAFEHAERLLERVPSCYGQVASKVYLALFACREGEFGRALLLLEAAENQAKQFSSPRDYGIVFWAKAVLRQYYDTIEAGESLRKSLEQTYHKYASQAFLYGKLGTYEKAILTKMLSANVNKKGLLYKFWNQLE